MTDCEVDSSGLFRRAADLLERELRKASSDTGLDTGARPDETTEFLRKDAHGMLQELATNPALYNEDPARAKDWFLKATALLTLDSVLTRTSGFHLETVAAHDPHLRILVPPGPPQPESAEILLLDIPEDVAEAVPGRVTVTGHAAAAERLGLVSAVHSESGHEAPHLAEQAFPAMSFEHATYLLMQQVLNGDAGARMSRGLRSDVTSYRLERSAKALIEDMGINGEAYASAPFLTAGRLLRFSALLGADRMLSHPDGIAHEGLGGPDRRIRIFVPVDRHPPEGLEVTLPALPLQ